MRIYEATISYNLVSLGENLTLDTPAKAAQYLSGAFDCHPHQESFWVLMLDRKNKPIGRIMVTLGTVSATLVEPREVLKPAILASASAIIVAHNHPSGDPAPSAADVRVTRQLREACEIVGIKLLDHVVIGTPESDPTGIGFYSFRDAGVI